MPKNLGETPTFDPFIAVPIDADPGNAASVEVPFQALTNRSRYLRGELDFIASEHQGVRQLRTVPTLDALRAIGAAERSDSQVVLVPGSGLFTWQPTAVGAETVPWSILPKDLPATGPGRWHVDFSAIPASPNGLATLDANGKLVPAQTPNRLVALYEVATAQSTSGPSLSLPQTSGDPPPNGTVQTVNLSVSGGNYQFATGMFIEDPRAGDILTIDIVTVLYVQNGGGGNLRLAITDGQSSVFPPEGVACVNNVIPWQRISMSSRYTLQNTSGFSGARVDLQMQVFGTNNTEFHMLYPTAIRVRQERP